MRIAKILIFPIISTIGFSQWTQVSSDIIGVRIGNRVGQAVASSSNGTRVSSW